jgi:uncharacterized membrane protein (UPF0127 family)
MKRVRVYADGQPVFEADVADTFFSRFRGLMGKSPIERPLWILPCADIHTFFMKEAIDVVFLSKEGKVLRVAEAMPKNKTSGTVKGGHSVLELPAHTLAGMDLLDVRTFEFIKEGPYAG